MKMIQTVAGIASADNTTIPMIGKMIIAGPMPTPVQLYIYIYIQTE